MVRLAVARKAEIIVIFQSTTFRLQKQGDVLIFVHYLIIQADIMANSFPSGATDSHVCPPQYRHPVKNMRPQKIQLGPTGCHGPPYAWQEQAVAWTCYTGYVLVIKRINEYVTPIWWNHSVGIDSCQNISSRSIESTITRKYQTLF